MRLANDWSPRDRMDVGHIASQPEQALYLLGFMFIKFVKRFFERLPRCRQVGSAVFDLL